MVQVLYFAWLRERIGKSGEVVDPPADIKTVGQLMVWLSARGDEYENAFSNPGIIRAAIDQTHVSADTSIANAREIAFFPPMTGG